MCTCFINPLSKMAVGHAFLIHQIVCISMSLCCPSVSRSYRLKFEHLFNHFLKCLESDGTFEDDEEQDSDMSYQVGFHITVLWLIYLQPRLIFWLSFLSLT